MARSGLFSRLKILNLKGAGLAALVLAVVLSVNFSSPQTYTAHAAGWLDKVFGDYKPRSKRRNRVRQYKAPRQNYYLIKNARSSKATLKRPRRARKARGIGKIGASRRKVRKKGRSFRIPKSRGTYRTMCVRTCDGYFFPVSFATGKGNLRKDARTCKSSCGSPAKLYYYPNPGGEPEDMISYRGKKKYSKLKNAFLFRKEFKADCRCQPEPWTQSAIKRHKQYAVVEAKQKKRLASRKKRARKKRYSKRRRTSRRYSRLSSKKRGRYVRTVGKKRKVKRKSRSKRSRRSARRTKNWTY